MSYLENKKIKQQPKAPGSFQWRVTMNNAGMSVRAAL